MENSSASGTTIGHEPSGERSWSMVLVTLRLSVRQTLYQTRFVSDKFVQSVHNDIHAQLLLPFVNAGQVRLGAAANISRTVNPEYKVCAKEYRPAQTCWSQRYEGKSMYPFKVCMASGSVVLSEVWVVAQVLKWIMKRTISKRTT